MIIVESPTKARTLSRFLGGKYEIFATLGHIRDLPKSEMGIDIANNFTPRYIIPRKKSAIHKELLLKAKKFDNLILATDPDREGEAIAYHVKDMLSSNLKLKITSEKFKRIEFHEITKEAIEAALLHPREIDIRLYDAQQARRVLDRLVGYSLSPLLWYKIKKGLSAGRVQSVAVRLIVDREREIIAFVPVEYWQIKVELKKDSSIFTALMIETDGIKVDIKNKQQADNILARLEKAQYVVSAINRKEVRRNAAPPFTTSTMQQGASNRFGFSSKATMRLAQDLYEEGLITYHRTDSLNLSPQAVTLARSFIEKQYGKEFLPPSPIFYKTKAKGAQEAHEAIRPTAVSANVEGLSPNHQKLYELIRLRFLACQMNPAVYDQTSVDILAAANILFRAVGTIVKFAGWRVLYGIKSGDRLAENEDEVTLPVLTVSDKLELVKILPLQKFTQGPPRFTEATLIKALEENGIGRPSTYAPTISTILDRGYIVIEERKLKPTELGFIVNDFLVKYFSNIMDIGFTAGMEEKLDNIARGDSPWVPVVAQFYKPFADELEIVKKTAKKVEMPTVEIGENCPQCNNPLVERLGKFGKFIACSTFPNCKYTRNLMEKINMPCPKCGGDIVLKRTKKGRPFYGCANYPKCDYASWKNPQVPVVAIPN